MKRTQRSTKDAQILEVRLMLLGAQQKSKMGCFQPTLMSGVIAMKIAKSLMEALMVSSKKNMEKS